MVISAIIASDLSPGGHRLPHRLRLQGGGRGGAEGGRAPHARPPRRRPRRLPPRHLRHPARRPASLPPFPTHPREAGAGTQAAVMDLVPGDKERGLPVPLWDTYAKLLGEAEAKEVCAQLHPPLDTRETLALADPDREGGAVRLL